MSPKTRATIEDLYKVEGKAELVHEAVIKSYKASDPEHPVIFWRGDMADAEPAVPGWQMAVDELFG